MFESVIEKLIRSKTIENSQLLFRLKTDHAKGKQAGVDWDSVNLYLSTEKSISFTTKKAENRWCWNSQTLNSQSPSLASNKKYLLATTAGCTTIFFRSVSVSELKLLPLNLLCIVSNIIESHWTAKKVFRSHNTGGKSSLLKCYCFPSEPRAMTTNEKQNVKRNSKRIMISISLD